MAAGYAILCGLELLAVQKQLKSASGCTFEQWLSNHQEALGFSRRTVFKYTCLAEHAKAKLQDKSTLLLMDSAPGSLTTGAREKLLSALHKSVDGQSLTELYEELGIARRRKPPVNENPANNGAATRKPADTELIIQDELFGRLDEAGRMIEWWGKPVKIGKAMVPVWQTMTEAQKADMEKRLELSLRQTKEMLDQLREARRK